MKLRVLGIFMAAVMLSVIALAGPKDETFHGVLTDVACAGKSAAHADKGKVKEHPVKCALMDGCVKSGFAISNEGKIYKLDAKGNEQALALLKGTKKEKDVMVEVVGTLSGDTITVTSIKEH